MLFTSTLLFASALAAAPTPQEILAKVQATYKNAGDITADFSQTYVDSLRGKKRLERGQLWAARDGRVRWTYVDPTAKDFVFDGETAYFYEPELGQVTVIEKFRDTQLANALSFLVGKGDLDALFTVSSAPGAASTNLELELLPKSPIPTVAKVQLSVDPKTYRVLKTVVKDPVGNSTTYELVNVAFNAKVDATRLAFTIPAGVQILRSAAATGQKPATAKP